MPLDPDALGLDPGPDMARVLRALAPDGQLRIHRDTVEQDLARLGLGLMEFLRRLKTPLALRRFEAGSVAESQEEGRGLTLMHRAAALRDLAGRSGVKEEDLHLDPDPPGTLT